eukprot:3833917-Prymnesium_polylepis.1
MSQSARVSSSVVCRLRVSGRKRSLTRAARSSMAYASSSLFSQMAACAIADSVRCDGAGEPYS